jgi:hypothetical protein
LAHFELNPPTTAFPPEPDAKWVSGTDDHFNACPTAFTNDSGEAAKLAKSTLFEIPRQDRLLKCNVSLHFLNRRTGV